MPLEKLKPQSGQSSVKRMFQRTLMVLFAMNTSMMISTASFASCGSLTMAEMNWASAELMAHVEHADKDSQRMKTGHVVNQQNIFYVT